MWSLQTVAEVRAGINTRNMAVSSDLRHCELSGRKLVGTDLRGVNLSSADLSQANLRDADLLKADLQSADFSNMRRDGADFSGAINLPHAFQIDSPRPGPDGAGR